MVILPNDREKVEEKLQIVEWKIAISQNSRGRKLLRCREKKAFYKNRAIANLINPSPLSDVNVSETLRARRAFA